VLLPFLHLILFTDNNRYNHKFLYFVNLLYIVFAVIVLGASVGVTSDTHLITLFPLVSDFAYGFVGLWIALFLIALLGMWGCKERSKVAVMWYVGVRASRESENEKRSDDYNCRFAPRYSLSVLLQFL